MKRVSQSLVLELMQSSCTKGMATDISKKLDAECWMLDAGYEEGKDAGVIEGDLLEW